MHRVHVRTKIVHLGKEDWIVVHLCTLHQQREGTRSDTARELLSEREGKRNTRLLQHTASPPASPCAGSSPCTRSPRRVQCRRALAGRCGSPAMHTTHSASSSQQLGPVNQQQSTCITRSPAPPPPEPQVKGGNKPEGSHPHCCAHFACVCSGGHGTRSRQNQRRPGGTV